MADEAPGPTRRGRRAAGRYGVVLLVLSGGAIFGILAPTGLWSRTVVELLQAAAVVVLLARREVERWILCLAVGLAVVMIGSRLGAPLLGTFALGVSDLAGSALLAVLPYAIILEFTRHRVVSTQSVLGALCIYVVLGMVFANVGSAVGAFSNRPYLTGVATATGSDYLYFSFITLTTTGYGDLAPAQPLARALAVLESLTGQLYLVTVVGVLVGTLTAQLMRRRGTPPD